MYMYWSFELHKPLIPNNNFASFIDESEMHVWFSEKKTTMTSW